MRGRKDGRGGVEGGGEVIDKKKGKEHAEEESKSKIETRVFWLMIRKQSIHGRYMLRAPW